MLDCAGEKRTAAVSVAKLTAAVAPGTRFRTFSMRTAQAAQVMPSSASSTDSVADLATGAGAATAAASCMKPIYTLPGYFSRYPWDVYPGLGRRRLERNPADQHVAVHHPVAEQAVERVAKGGRTVVL